MQVVYHDNFDFFDSDEKSRVFEIFPNVFGDSRGSFTEVLKKSDESNNDIPSWLSSLSWIAQVNRSNSVGKVIRGCHAQKGQWCQAKLVQAVTQKIFDVITDARPDSATFGISEVVPLDPQRQNQLFVPRGFLHAFVTTSEDKSSVFEYFCDNVYCKASETGVNPMTLLPNVAASCKQMLNQAPSEFGYLQEFVDLLEDVSSFNLSEKDLKAMSYDHWMLKAKIDFETTRKLWYRT